MKIVRQLAIILIICFLGELLRRVLGVPIPGNVIGMMILIICLSTGVIKVEFIEDVSNFLLNHLAFFFLPAGVGLITSIGVLRSCWQNIVLIAVISTIVVMVATGITVQLLKRS